MGLLKGDLEGLQRWSVGKGNCQGGLVTRVDHWGPLKGGSREQTSSELFLTSTCVLWHVHIFPTSYAHSDNKKGF